MLSVPVVKAVNREGTFWVMYVMLLKYDLLIISSTSPQEIREGKGRTHLGTPISSNPNVKSNVISFVGEGNVPFPSKP